MDIRKRILPNFGTDKTRIRVNIIKTRFSENSLRGQYTRNFQKLSKNVFSIFLYIHVPMDIRKRIIPNLGHIKHESELI